MKEFEEHYYVCGKCGKIYDNDFGSFQCCRKQISKETAEMSVDQRKPIGMLYGYKKVKK